MAINNKANPIIIGSTSMTASAFIDGIISLNEILWVDVTSSCSLAINDDDGNELYHIVADPGTVRVLEDTRVFANGLKFSTSTSMEDGRLFIYVR